MKQQTKPFVIVIKSSRRCNKKRVSQSVSAVIAGEPSKVPAKDIEKTGG